MKKVKRGYIDSGGDVLGGGVDDATEGSEDTSDYQSLKLVGEDVLTKGPNRPPRPLECP